MNKYINLKFDPDGQAWIVTDDGEGHHAMLNLNNIILATKNSGITGPALRSALAKELAEVGGG
jgi:beta-xylosidase